MQSGPGARRFALVAPQRVADAARLGRPALTLLLADPDPAAGAVVQELCAGQDVEFVGCLDGASALFQAGRLRADLLVLSADLPVVSAPEVITAIRRHEALPVVLAVEDGRTGEASAGVAAGAGGIISRPYRRPEVQALLEVHLARALPRHEQRAVLTAGAITLNSPAHQVLVAGRPVALSVRDFALLRALMLDADRVVTTDRIREHVWAGESATGNTIAVHVRRLRLRLAGAAQIIGVRGVGYRLVPAGREQPGDNGGSPASA